MSKVSAKIRGSRYSQMVALLVSTSLMPIGDLQAQAKAAEVTSADLVYINSVKESSGNGGGEWVVEDPGIVNRGEITRIRVCHGRFINRITVDYNTSARGKELGGPGGNCDDFDLAPGEFIREVRTWSGDWMNALQFVTNQRTSDRYGDPAGGSPEAFIDPDGGALRQVDGKFGAYLNQARFSFGLPYKLSNFKLHIPPGAYDPARGELREIEAVRRSLCEYTVGSAPPAEISKGFSNSVSDSHKFSFGSSTTFGLESTVSVGVPSIGEFGVTIKAEQNFTFGVEDTTETTNTRTEDFKFYLPAGYAAEAVFTAKANKLNVPFTYTLSHYRGGNPNLVVKSKEYSGTYEGVLFNSTDVSVYEIDCVTKERKTRYPNGGAIPQREPQPAPAGNDGGVSGITRPETSEDFTGTWSCPPYGSIIISQSGNVISGNYSWGGGGTFRGAATDRTMRVDVFKDDKPIPYVWDMSLSSDGSRLDGTVTENLTASSQWGCSRTGAP